MTTRRKLLWLALLAAIVAAAAAWGWPSQHVAYGPLRDCLALRGGLVTPVANGAALEGTARVQVGTDVALIAVAATPDEAKALAGQYLDARRYDNLVVSPGVTWPSGASGDRALAAVKRCLSDAHGAQETATLGWIYPAETIAQVQKSCRKVRASIAQCRCVLTGAQAQLSPGDFQLAADGASIEAELAMADILDGCRLVG